MQQDSLSINKVKDNIINNILQKLITEEGLTPIQAELKKKELEAKIKSKQLLTNAEPQTGTTNASKINNTLDSLYIDLLTTFGCLNELDGTIDKHLDLNEATISNLKSQISKANDRIDSFESIIGAKGNPSHHIEGFRDSDDFESDQKFYTERYGELTPLSCKASYNNGEEVITLPRLSSSNAMLYSEGISAGSISINKQLGKGLLKLSNDKNNLENIIDSSMQSYWADTIFCDEPMKVTYDSSRPTNTTDLKDFYYGLTHGAMCELVLSFEVVSIINEITLAPYGLYPIDIIAIRYKTSDNIDEPLEELIFPNNVIVKDRVGKTISSPTSFRFPNVGCKKIFILFNQVHYVRNTFVYNTNDVFKNELWFNITSKNTETLNIKNDLLFKPIYVDRGLDDASWVYINNLAVKNKSLDLKKILIDNNTSTRIATKYQYNYGFYNISPNLNNFEKTGVYISSPISAKGNIQSIRITTEESHPLTTEGNKVTDIEYYISYSSNPVASDWKNILPRNIEVVECELLQLVGGVFPLRFPAKDLISVNVNGKPLEYDVDYTTDEISVLEEVDPEFFLATRSITIFNVDMFSIYTCSYRPVNKCKSLILMNGIEESATINSLEFINATNTSRYELSDFPYINLSNEIGTSVKLTNKNTGALVSQNEGQILCITNFYSPSESYKNFDKNLSKIQYYTDKNYIYFDDNIPDYFQIEINYNHYVSSIRTKAILRRNISKESWMTPVLDKIKYEFITID